MRENRRLEPGGISEGEKKSLWSRYFFLLQGPTKQEATNGKDSCDIFSGIHRALGDRMLARAPVSATQDLHRHGPRCFNCPSFCMTCGLEKLGRVELVRA